jgi:hypothetical protein
MHFLMHAYSDADWADDLDHFSSIGAYIVYLGHNPISWSFEMQKIIARYFTEVEYWSIANTAAELIGCPPCYVILVSHYPLAQSFTVTMLGQLSCYRLPFHS